MRSRMIPPCRAIISYPASAAICWSSSAGSRKAVANSSARSPRPETRQNRNYSSAGPPRAIDLSSNTSVGEADMAFVLLIVEKREDRLSRPMEVGRRMYDQMLRYCGTLQERGILRAVESLKPD